jgi:CelD/BcsL family acetyltransferase involved in cellulose biosynthesis
VKPSNAQAALPAPGMARRPADSDVIPDRATGLPWAGEGGPFAPGKAQRSLAPKVLQDGTLEITVCDALEDARADWLDLEASALATPYQQFRFIEAWDKTLNAKGDVAIRIVVGRDSSGNPLMILPLGIQTSYAFPLKPSAGLVWLGGKHVNYNQGLFAPELLEHWNEAAWQRVLCDILDILEPDHVCMLNQPVTIAGFANPFLAVTHRASPSKAYAADIEGAPEAVLAQLRNRMSRKKIRRNIRRLEETVGAVTLLRAEIVSDIATTLGTMQNQRLFRRSGNTAPCSQHLAFLRHAADTTDGPTAAPVEIYALRAGNETIATFGCAVHAGRASGMFISVDLERFGQSSPGDIILSEVIASLCARGFHTFDLGIGEFEYKRRWCDEKQDMFDVVSGHRSRTGALAARIIQRWLDWKSYIKRRPQLYRKIHRLGLPWW